MPYDPSKHHRRSIRLRGYDYTQPGAYFVTICTQGRAKLFDDPALRQIAEEQWRALNHAGLRGAHAGRVSVDTWIVMPDHVHAIVVIADAAGDGGDDARGDVDARGVDVGAQQPGGDSFGDGIVAAAPLRDHVGDDPRDHVGDHAGNHDRMDINVEPGSLGAIVRSYKSAVARRINRRRRTPGALVWQRGYYERIIRDAPALAAIRRYIRENPARHAARLDALLRRMQRKD